MTARPIAAKAANYELRHRRRALAGLLALGVAVPLLLAGCTPERILTPEQAGALLYGDTMVQEFNQLNIIAPPDDDQLTTQTVASRVDELRASEQTVSPDTCFDSLYPPFLLERDADDTGSVLQLPPLAWQGDEVFGLNIVGRVFSGAGDADAFAKEFRSANEACKTVTLTASDGSESELQFTTSSLPSGTKSDGFVLNVTVHRLDDGTTSTAYVYLLRKDNLVVSIQGTVSIETAKRALEEAVKLIDTQLNDSSLTASDNATAAPEDTPVAPEDPTTLPDAVAGGVPSADEMCSALQSLPNLDAVAGGTVTEFDPQATSGNMYGGDSTGCVGYYGPVGTDQFVTFAYFMGDETKMEGTYGTFASMGQDVPLGTKATCSSTGCLMIVPGALLYFTASNSTLAEDEWPAALTAVSTYLGLI